MDRDIILSISLLFQISIDLKKNHKFSMINLDNENSLLFHILHLPSFQGTAFHKWEKFWKVHYSKLNFTFVARIISYSIDH